MALAGPLIKAVPNDKKKDHIMAKFTKNIERMIKKLHDDEKIWNMHAINIIQKDLLRERRAELCRLFLAAYRYHKNDSRAASQENKRPTLSLNRTVSKRENRIITVGNKKAYQVGKGDYKHRNGVIIEN